MAQAHPAPVARPRAVLPVPRRTPVKSVRGWFGLTQGEFARVLGVSRATLARWEAHRTGPEPNSAEGRLLTALLEAKELAINSFGPQHGREWFRSAIPALEGKRPIDVLVTRGPVPVRDVLWEAWEGTY